MRVDKGIFRHGRSPKFISMSTFLLSHYRMNVFHANKEVNEQSATTGIKKTEPNTAQK